uniref:ArsR family transcriptional regulator n=1 Tax=candidate division WWE3 bacterium TaxID=2053526 RepID=A0A831Z1G9_UNCKA
MIKPGRKVARSARRIREGAIRAVATAGSLKRLFVSQARIDILKLFLLRPAISYHVREITRRVGTEINAVRRELENLKELGMLQSASQKNRLYYALRRDFPLLGEVLGLVVKEEGLGKALTRERGLGEVKFAFISIPFLLGRKAGEKDIDLMVVGRIPLKKVSEIVKEEEKHRGHEINYAVLSEKEFEELKKRRDPLIINALLQPKVVLTAGAESYLTL